MPPHDRAHRRHLPDHPHGERSRLRGLEQERGGALAQAPVRAQPRQAQVQGSAAGLPARPELRFELLEACDFEVLGARERVWIATLKREGVRLYNEVLLEERQDVSRVAAKLWEIDKAYKAERSR